ncbi:MAG: solute-binding protein [Alphaproteobacteria bacterium]|nr:solute-binding protein [Alphaproteobacteria bacterium]
MNLRITLLLKATVLCLLATQTLAQEKFFVLASTTSTQNSGLFDVILPIFTAETGIQVRVVAVGTGQALRIARNGDADALLVHHRPSEDAFIAQGYGIERRDIMYNDFVIVGPANDPANVRSAPDAPSALAMIANSGASFASRGDDSGTNKKEIELWRAAGITPKGAWYLETGSGMGATLNLASARQIYTLTDRGTWITFGNKGGMKLLFSGDKALFNPYGYILVDPKRFPHVKVDMARAFSDWLISGEGQKAIGDFRIEGFQAFCPNALNLAAEVADRAACPAEAD